MKTHEPAAPPEETARRGRWSVVAMLFFFMLINYADRAILGLAAEPIMRDLDLDARRFGLIGSAFFLCFSLSALCAGFLIDRLPSRSVLFWFALAWSAAQAPMALGGGFLALLLSRMALGAGEGPAYPAALHCAFKYFPDARRALPAALVTQGSAMGVVAAGPILNWIILAYGWRAAFGVLCAAGLVWAALWLAVTARAPAPASAAPAPPGGAPEPPQAAAPAQRVPYRRLILNPAMLSLWGTMFASAWTLALLIVWFPAFLRTGLGAPETRIGFLSALPWLGGALVVLAAGWGSQALLLRGASSRAARAALPCALGLLGAACLAAGPVCAAPAAQFVLVCCGLVLPNAIVAPAQAAMAEIAPESQRAAVLSMGNGVAGLAGVIAPYASGALIAEAATPAAGFAQVFLLCAGVVALANGLGLWLIRLQPSARQEASGGARGGA